MAKEGLEVVATKYEQMGEIKAESIRVRCIKLKREGGGINIG